MSGEDDADDREDKMADCDGSCPAEGGKDLTKIIKFDSKVKNSRASSVVGPSWSVPEPRILLRDSRCLENRWSPG
ncbi:unnamed protein product [Boreogadus saida]